MASQLSDTGASLFDAFAESDPLASELSDPGALSDLDFESVGAPRSVTPRSLTDQVMSFVAGSTGSTGSSGSTASTDGSTVPPLEDLADAVEPLGAALEESDVAAFLAPVERPARASDASWDEHADTAVSDWSAEDVPAAGILKRKP